MENYSPRSQNLLRKKIPLCQLDSQLGSNPFTNSLKDYDPTETMDSRITASVERYPPDANNNKKIKKLQSIGNSLEDDYPKKITDLNFGAPPDFDFDDDL